MRWSLQVTLASRRDEGILTYGTNDRYFSLRFCILHSKEWFPVWVWDGSISLFPDLTYLVSNLDCTTTCALTITKSWQKIFLIDYFFLMHLQEKWKIRNKNFIKNRISQIKWSFIYMLLWRHNMLFRAKKHLVRCILS